MLFNGPSLFRRFIQPFLISASNLSVLLVLFSLRSLDDNRMTSWNWVLADAQVWKIFSALLFGLLIAYSLSRTAFAERRPVLSIFIISFSVTIPFWRSPEAILDASRYFTQAKHLETYGIMYFLREWGNGIHAWTDMPLMPFLYGLIFRLFGESRIYIQIFTSLLFSLTCVITFHIGKSLWNRDTGLYGGLLLMGIPYLLTQVPLMLVDIPTMFLLTLSAYAFIKAIDSGRTWVVTASVVVFLALIVKYSAWLMLTVLFVIFPVLLKTGKTSRKEAIRSVLVIACISGILATALFAVKFTVFSEQVRLLREYQMPGLRRWGESFVSSFFFQVHPFITFFAFFSVFVAALKRDVRFVIIAWLVFLVVFLQIRRIRYIMVVFPMLALMASYGMQKIQSPETRKFLVFSIVTFSLVVALCMYLPFLQRMDLSTIQQAGRFLDSLEGSGVEVFTLPAKESVVNPAVVVPLLDYFTVKKIYYSYDEGGTIPAQNIKESPLRFTWEYRNPGYYHSSVEPGRKPLMAIISCGPVSPLPEYLKKRTSGCKKKSFFEPSPGLFLFSPRVMVCQP